MATASPGSNRAEAGPGPGSTDSAPIERWLVVQGAGGEVHDIAVRAGPAATVGDVAACLAGELGLAPRPPREWAVFCHRRGTWLPTGEPLSRAGVLHGDVIAVVAGAGGAGESTTPPAGAGEPVDQGCVLFNRPPRVVRPEAGRRWELPAPPLQPGSPRLPLVTALVPLLLGAVVVAFTRSAVTMLFLLLSPVMALASYTEGRVGGRGEFRRSRAAFESRLRAVEVEVRRAQAGEVRARGEEAPGLRRLALAAHTREAWLWERRPQDPDFLVLRVGLAEALSRHTVSLPDGGSTPLRDDAVARLARLRNIQGVPLCLSLADHSAVGLVGPRAPVLDLARWLVVQAAVLHSPRNLSICAAIGGADVAEWEWLKWLPHTEASTRPVEGTVLHAGAAGGRDLVARLLGLLDARASEAGTPGGSGRRTAHPHVLAVLDQSIRVAPASVNRLLAEGPAVGIVVIWLGGAVRDLPNDCRAVIDVDADGSVTVTLPEDGRVTRADGRADRAGAAEARQVALELAPLRDPGAADGRGWLPRSVGLLNILDLPAGPGATAIAARWSSSVAGLAAPIGATSEGVFSVDLVADGPHALIAGTTGAGKSELLRTLVASLAASHPPARLNFLLVDYKGGAAFREAAELPHTVGVVTDLDDHLAARALLSLRAELRRREEVLREAGARDLADLERRGGDGCPPSLVIVVDEFATLTREVPEFVDGVVDLAQRGRSLGLHLVLATQRPAGVVSDSIRANTNLRVALRVAADADSADVVGVTDAARIPRSVPGRCLVRTGHMELTEFQAAYSGTVDSAPAGGEPAIATLALQGPRWMAPQTGGGVSDLHQLVGAINQAHEVSGARPARRPWLPPLPAVLPAPALDGAGAGLRLPLGLLDLPHCQRQEPWILDLEASGSLLVMGGRGSGKTSLLRLVARSLGSLPVSRVHLYVVDCAGGGLASIGALPHCGAYIRDDETERIGRLLRWLRGAVDSRRRRAAEVARGEPAGERPAIVVLLDSYGGFTAAMERVDHGEHLDGLPRLVADGPAAGVHFVVTAERRGAVPGALAGLISTRLVLRMADEDEYRNAGVAPAAVRGAAMPPGRGFLDGLEVQCAVLGNPGTAEQQRREIERAALACHPADGEAVPGILLLPGRVEWADLPRALSPLAPVVGISDGDHGPAVLELGEDHQLVVGPPRSGRSTTLAAAARSLREASPGTRLVLLAPRRSPLTALLPWTRSASGADACSALARELAAGISPDAAMPAVDTVIVVDDGEEIQDGPTADALLLLARRGRDRGIRILAAVETRAAQRAYTGWVAELRKARQGIILEPEVDLDGDILGTRLPRRPSGGWVPGRAFLVTPRTARLVQVAATPGSPAQEPDLAVPAAKDPHQRVGGTGRRRPKVEGLGATVDKLTIKLAE